MPCRSPGARFTLTRHRQADQGVVARVHLNGIQEHEDLALVEDPFGEPIVRAWRPDRGADVEWGEPHPRGE